MSELTGPNQVRKELARAVDDGFNMQVMRTFYDKDRDRIITYYVPRNTGAEPDQDAFAFTPLRRKGKLGKHDSSETPNEFIAFDNGRPLILATSHRPDDFDTIGMLEESAYGNRYHRICLHLVQATRLALENGESRPVVTFHIPEVKKFSLASLKSRLLDREAEATDTPRDYGQEIDATVPNSEVA